MLPQAAAEHYQAQQRLTVATLGLTRREWATMGPDFDDSWDQIGPRITLLTASAQLGAARGGAAYVPTVLAELGQSVAPLGEVDPEAFVGVASDGRPLDSLLYNAVTTAKSAAQGLITTDGSVTTHTRGASSQQALALGGLWLDMAIHTQVADAGRGAASVAIATRPRVGYVRMTNPPCCPHCAVLAGKWFRWNQGFDRHPRCDCTHVPSSELGTSTSWPTPSPDQITGLSRAQRRAINDGADLNQVVNSERGRSGMTTTEGTTRRGLYGGYRRNADGSLTSLTRAESRALPRRLTPDGIYRIAPDRTQAVEMLRENGYLTSAAIQVNNGPAAIHAAALQAKTPAAAVAPIKIEWKGLSQAEISALSDGTALGDKVAAKTREVYVSGNKSVVIEAKMTKAQTKGLLDDIGDVVSQTQHELGAVEVTFRVPVGDKYFKGTKKITGAYVPHGASEVFINPKVASGQFNDLPPSASDAFMPAAKQIGFRKYTINHELGHINDGAKLHTSEPPTFTPSGLQLPKHTRDDAAKFFDENKANLSKYGKTNAAEGYAEAFVQWVQGESHPAAEAYARRYGWSR